MRDMAENLPETLSDDNPDTVLNTTTEDEHLSQQELDQIWARNSSVPASIDGVVHDLISQNASLRPTAPAVCAWDGEFTYQELDVLSNQLAYRLIALDVKPKSIVPILIEKSKWTPVAMLGIIKAGCAAVALDHNHPDARLKTVLQQVRPSVILSSVLTQQRASTLASTCVICFDESFSDRPVVPTTLPFISSSDIVYVSFTSGTTGSPKGACISHSNVRSAVCYQGQKLGFNQRSRVFDFAPYSFDVAWSNFLHTLCAGGCICIASEEDMLDNLSSAITKFKATLLNVTPTILRTINPVPPTLQTVLMSGEMPYQENITHWAGKLRLLNTYGPTECTFKCCFSVLNEMQLDRPDIGQGVGFCTWIVSASSGAQLVRDGFVGELYLEGPLVGQGYLSAPDLTATAFVNDPSWLLTGSSVYAGRRGRLYRTGDLVKRNANGDLLFVGRKDDAQLKIRGQRVEVGDVEHHVRACIANRFSIIVDVIQPRGHDTLSLALFVEIGKRSTSNLQVALNELRPDLAQLMPGFMIPSIYIPVNYLPIAGTGKVDRRKLRKMASTLSWSEMIEGQETILKPKEHQQPTTGTERELQRIWAEILGLDSNLISMTDSFLRKGGDSVAAMRVVAAARTSGLSLTVAEIFKTNTLTELACLAKPLTDAANIEHVPPFSLLRNYRHETEVCEEVARLCGVLAEEIEDVYPCTALQEGMLAMTAKDEGKYVSSVRYKLSSRTDLERLKNAWHGVVQAMPILRTRIVELSGEGLVHVVTKPLEQWYSSSHDSHWGDHDTAIALGTPLSRTRLMYGEPGYMVLEMHHAIYDGWSRMLLLDALEELYETQTIQHPFAPFQAFVKNTLAIDRLDAQSYWKGQLENPEAIVYPSPNYLSGVKNDLVHRVSGLRWPRTDFTPSTLVHSAVAILLASYTNANDVRFGTTVSGRQAAVPGIERVAGPTIATIPFRMRVEFSNKLNDLQQMVQNQVLEATKYEQSGLSEIQRAGADMEDASQFQFLLVVQPESHDAGQSKHGLLSRADVDSYGTSSPGQDSSMSKYNSYAIMVICQLTSSGAVLTINHDTGSVVQKEARRIAFQLEHLLQQMCSVDSTQFKIQDVLTPNEHDLRDIWTWNSQIMEPVRGDVNTMIDAHAISRPDAPAVVGWDWQLNYRQLRNVSSYIADQLVAKGVIPGSTVLLSLDKSAWMAVLLVAVLKIGAIALPVSAKSSVHNANELVETLQPRIAISSASSDSCPFRALLPTLHVSEFAHAAKVADQSYQYSHENTILDPAIILFTSGSTGASKGILWSHGTLSNNARALCETFGLSSKSRVFQFSDYEYDVSNIETLTTLSIGGRLCIPTESDRSNRMAGAIDDMQATWMCLTPSVAETLNPADVPSLEVLVCAGELLQVKTASRWMKSHVSFFNWYGPAEAAVATSYLVRENTWVPGLIGRGEFCLNWLVNPRDPNVLAPIGAISELCIEGPILAAGYVGKNSQSLDEKAFLAPPWLNESSDTAAGYRRVVYKTGDLVKYGADGQLIFVSRSKDFERKLHGRRIDLNEIQNHVQQCLSQMLPVKSVAEIFAPYGSDMETLALFVSPDKVSFLSEQEAVAYIRQNLSADDLEAQLSNVLSENLIPRLYIPIAKIPISHAGKTNRRRLREIGSSLTYDSLAKLQPLRRAMRKPSSFMERRLQQLWSSVMSIDANSIYADDSFFRLGGDSITAMRLVAVGRQHDISLTVAQIFQNPRLASMAQVARQVSGSTKQTIAPFSLLPLNMTHNEYKQYAAEACQVPASDIIDMYPCTALQEGLLAMTMKNSTQYVSRSVLELQVDIEPNFLRTAWQATAEKLPILRTRIFDIPRQGLVQVVLRDVPWRSASDIALYLIDDEHDQMGLGTELCRAAVINHSFILTIHHCLYDWYVLKMILDEIEAQYFHQQGLVVTPYQTFIKYVREIDVQRTEEYWKTQLLGCELTPFPILPNQDYVPQADERYSTDIVLKWPRNGMTPSTIIRATWSILTALYTATDRVVFGAVVSGRQLDVRGVDTCPGPTISTVPVAVSISGDETVQELQERIQLQAVEMMSYEHYGLQNIRKATQHTVSELFQTLLVVQPVAEGKSLVEDNSLFKARSFASTLETQGTDPFNIYALMLMCELNDTGLRLNVSFDSSVIESWQIRCIAAQFGQVMKQLCGEDIDSLKVSAVQAASESDLALFISENDVPEEPAMPVHDLVSVRAKQQPHVTAIHAWDGQLSYRMMETLSNILCDSLLVSGIVPGDVVVVYMEKSYWVPVAQLAILKAGAVCLLQSASAPEQRLKRVFDAVNPKFVLVSEGFMTVATQYRQCYTVEQFMDEFPSTDDTTSKRPQRGMYDLAMILVTSGSTGEPKRILWSHRNLTANALAWAQGNGINNTKRVFQFSSYDFDVATDETFAALLSGGCVCTPSESERLNDIAAALNHYKCTHAFITPSLARHLDPQQVLYLDTLALGGEAVERADFNRWKNIRHLVNAYGPAECSMSTFYNVVDTTTYTSGNIGRSSSSSSTRCWLINPKNPDVLVPRGAIGEIALEGPSCAIGYADDVPLTSQSFYSNPEFLSFRNDKVASQRQPSRIYCTGDLARRDASGNLIFLGRSSNLFKIRGQLANPGEIEHYVKQYIVGRDDVKVLAEVVLPQGQLNKLLVVFINFSGETKTSSEEVASLTNGINDALKAHLPSFSIPSYYIPLHVIPMTSTGKRDRKMLQQIGACFNLPQNKSQDWQEPSTVIERSLRDLWSQVLDINADTISINDSFLQKGDSIQAMRLVSMVRQHGWLLNVAEIFQNPSLCDMAKCLRIEEQEIETSIEPFSMIQCIHGTQATRQIAASLCSLNEDEIEDIFPCTALQVGLLALTASQKDEYVSRDVLLISASIDIDRFKEAWKSLVLDIPILRTRIIDLEGQGFVQVVTKGTTSGTSEAGISEYLLADRDLPMDLGSPLMRSALVPGEPVTTLDQPSHYFVLTLHHSVYDGLTMSLIIEMLEAVYNRQTPPQLCSFQSFVRHTISIDTTGTAQYWSTQFDELEATQFPSLDSVTHQPKADSAKLHWVETIDWRSDNHTIATIIRSTWAILCSRYTNSSDIIFGTIVSGRNASLRGIDRVAGPTIASVPIRIRLDNEKQINELLSSVQLQATEMIPYEHTGLSRIRQCSDEAQQACRFQTMLVIQPPEQAIRDSKLFVKTDQAGISEDPQDRYKHFNTYALLIVCTPQGSRLKIEVSFDSTVIQREAIDIMVRQFEHVLKCICKPPPHVLTVGDIDIMTDRELDQIWRWNSKVPKVANVCVHDLISRNAQFHSKSVAVSGWDGEVTYKQLDQFSNDLAHRMVQFGIQPKSIVSLCFDKSMLTTIVYLGVIKAGAAVLLLDTTQPELRLKALVQQISPCIIISARTQQELAARLGEKVMVVSADLKDLECRADAQHNNVTLPTVDPDDLLYVTFTSGSTGQPKGCLSTHRNWSSATALQHDTLGWDNSTRVYDFASYAFDATHWSMLHVLTAGGTLCVPSEEARRSNLQNSIREFGTTDIFLTPVTAQLIQPSTIPTLRNIYIGGEAVTKDDLAPWIACANATIVYGPTECSAITLYWSVPDPMSPILSIGNGLGVVTWIVDHTSGKRLAPIGTVGELYLEGPLVGQGYLHNTEATNSAFVSNPVWLKRKGAEHTQERNRSLLYRTGDLVRYDPADGKIHFVARKDTQVKLRGQRLELSEVEYHVRDILKNKGIETQMVAEVINLKVTKKQILVLFISLGKNEKHSFNDLRYHLSTILPERLPSYMIPAAYIPIETIPLTTGGKVDRKCLRDTGSSLDLETLMNTSTDGPGGAPATEMQRHLQKIWEIVLRGHQGRIGLLSNFFRLGGDSVSAMQLAGLARNQRLSLTVRDILTNPQFHEMAEMIKPLHVAKDTVLNPFALLQQPNSLDSILVNVAAQCRVDIEDIEDIFPCTGVQKSLVSVTAKRPGDYIATFRLNLKKDVDVARFKQAWEDVSQGTAAILRTRIVDAMEQGLVQVQLRCKIEWESYPSVESYLEKVQEGTSVLGVPLTRFGVVPDPATSEICFMFTQHHAVYDGYSLDLLLTEVTKAYGKVVDLTPVAPFQAFFEHIHSLDKQKANEFWQRQLSDSEAIPFPPLPSQDYQPKADRTVQHTIKDFRWPNRDVTASSLLRAVWSILTSRYTDSTDIVFGALTSGRQAPIPGIERMVAPLITAHPVRVKIDQQQTVQEFLDKIQRQSIEMIDHEHTELLDIRRISSDVSRASHFNSLLIVQPVGGQTVIAKSTGPFRHPALLRATSTNLDRFNPHAVMIMCQLQADDTLPIEINFDSHVVDAPQMERILHQFIHILSQLAASSSERVMNIRAITGRDTNEIWRWNDNLPRSVTKCVHEMIGEMAREQPEAQALCAWNGSLSYREIDTISDKLASHLISLGAGPGTIIPLCFEKSLWMPVAALGAMKSGSACVAMDITQPEARLRSIMTQLQPTLILASTASQKLAYQISDADVVVIGDREQFMDPPHTTTPKYSTRVQPSDLLYVVFTSGSTGTPKGIMVSHENFASAAGHQADALRIRKGTRVFDFVSYSFDVAWSNLLSTLILGGCLCIPSESERRNDIAGSFNRLKADYAYFTPSVARSLDPSAMSSLKILAMGGEPIRSSDVSRWAHAENIIGICGPAECAQLTTVISLKDNTRSNQVGTAFGARTWLVEPGSSDHLAAIGAVGEMIVEGPIVSRGYIGDTEKTSAAYIDPPAWYWADTTEVPRENSKFYRTGDLFRYQSDGTLEFIGRKDTMIKLRGQRIELEEVEFHVRSALKDSHLCSSIAAEIIVPKGSSNPVLGLFINVSGNSRNREHEDYSSELIKLTDGLDTKLSEALPQYMIPSTYIQVKEIPMTTTNKIDRRALREIGNAKTTEQLAALHLSGTKGRAPSTDFEYRLQKLWSSILELDPSSINADSHFLRIGGESIAAMRMVSAARKENLILTVADVFNAPRLCQLAKLVKETNVTEDEDDTVNSEQLRPFSLLPTEDTAAFLENYMNPLLDPEAGSIEDVVPATAFQKRAILDALQDPPSRLPQFIIDLPTDVDFSRLERSCRRLTQHFDVLRAVFIEAEGKFWQVYLAILAPGSFKQVELNDKNSDSPIDAVCEEDLKRSRQLGQSLVQFVAMRHWQGHHKLMFRLSHAQFDGFCLSSLFSTLSSIYQSEQLQLPSPVSFRKFITFNELKRGESLQYWNSRLRDCSPPSWSTSDSTNRAYSTSDRITMKVTIDTPKLTQQQNDFSAATVFHAACALVLFEQFNQMDLLFGRLVLGRTTLPARLQSVMGPCLTEVPIRIKIEADDTITSIASRLHHQFLKDAHHEAAGMDDIIQHCTNWGSDQQDFGWRTAFQQEEEHDFGGDIGSETAVAPAVDDSGFTFAGSPSRISHYDHPMLPRTRPEIYATPRGGGRQLDLEFEGNRRLITEDTVRTVLNRLGEILVTYGSV